MNQHRPANTEIYLYEVLRNIPIFNPDLGESEIPEVVISFLTKVRESDGVIISTPEYAHGIPGALKNALDWMLSSDAIVLKPVVVTSVSTSGLGGMRSHAALVLVLSAMNANVVVEGSINLPYAHHKFNHNNELIDDVSVMALERAIKNL